MLKKQKIIGDGIPKIYNYEIVKEANNCSVTITGKATLWDIIQLDFIDSNVSKISISKIGGTANA